MLSLLILEVGLSFVPMPDWWEAGIFIEYLYSTRIQKRLLQSHEHNRLGYRDSEWTVGGKKVAFFGDSRTYGLFVHQSQTYAEQIEIMSNWEGMNVGLPGATTFEALDSLVPDALPYQPQASVVCLDLNSSLLSYVTRDKSGGRNAFTRNLLRSSSIWMFAEGGWHSLYSDRVPVIPLDKYKRQLHQIFNILEENDVRKNILLVGYTPLEDYPNLYTQQEYDRYREASRTVARARSVPIIEFTKELGDLSLNEAYIGEHQIHLTETGHQRIASAVLRILNED
ncbi:MAG: GDSL-type esterase/lipase family protein [Myxococcota bacterium]|nr:GDSL-type esterase/lipase family protein [Myxococcota bacterium]